MVPRYAATALWGVSTHFGAAQSLTQAGHLLGHVRDSAGALVVSRDLSTHPNSQLRALLMSCLCMRLSRWWQDTAYRRRHMSRFALRTLGTSGSLTEVLH